MATTDGETPQSGAHAEPPLPPPPPTSSWTPRMPVAPAAPGPTAANPMWGGALSSPWRRLGGYLIDGLVLFVPTFILLVVFVVNSPVFTSVVNSNTQNPTPEQLQQLTNDLRGPFLLLVLMQGVYTVLFIHLRGQTPGKMAVGIRVVQIENGERPSWGRAGIRWGVPALASLVPSVGGLLVLLIYLWMLWDPQRQGLHDKAARTVVVRKAP